ncbi:MAG: MmgE/PrpD family protein, partial [Alphaproteobacteria bacterium]
MQNGSGMVLETPERGDERDFAFVLADYAARLRLADIPRPAIAAAKTNIFDTLACAVAGSSAPAIRDVVDLAVGWG